jgi:hypothetical protein
MEMDRRLEMGEDEFTDILRTPEPERHLSEPASPQLFNLDEDPAESQDLSERCPDRARRMLRELETWFEQVEVERRSIKE